MRGTDPLEPLLAFLERLPAMHLPAGRASIGGGVADDGRWWVTFSLDTRHRLASRVVQELGHTLNDLAVDECLPTVFKPASPPPSLDGGAEFLSWVIESQDARFTPADCAGWLRGQLPHPVSDLDAWAGEPSLALDEALRLVQVYIGQFLEVRVCGDPRVGGLFDHAREYLLYVHDPSQPHVSAERYLVVSKKDGVVRDAGRHGE